MKPSAVDRVVLWRTNGRRPGTRVFIRRGEDAVLGRGMRGDHALGDDRRVAAQHFKIEWRGSVPWMRALAGDTFLDGRACDEAPLSDGAWLRAADTDLVAYCGPASAQRGVPHPRAAAALAELVPPAAQRLFAVVDGARDPRVLELLRRSEEHHASLYEGGPLELVEAGPFLVELPDPGGLRARLVGEGWGRSFGIFIFSATPFAELRRHLRTLLITTGERRGERAYFRFYDPRVLRVVAPVLAPAQRERIVAPASELLFEGESGAVLRLRSSASHEDLGGSRT